jgi:hypothetical protein
MSDFGRKVLENELVSMILCDMVHIPLNGSHVLHNPLLDVMGARSLVGAK